MACCTMLSGATNSRSMSIETCRGVWPFMTTRFRSCISGRPPWLRGTTQPESRRARASLEKFERHPDDLFTNGVRGRGREVVPHYQGGFTPERKRQVNQARRVIILIRLRSEDARNCDRE